MTVMTDSSCRKCPTYPATVITNTLPAPEAQPLPGRELSAIWLGRERVLSRPLCSCSQASMDPVPEFMKRFPGLSWLVVGVRATTSGATP
jgi:hypothetical protein